MTRMLLSLLGAGISAMSTGIASQPSLAQALSQPSGPGQGLGDLISDPGMWLTNMFNAALVNLGQKTTGDVVGFMDWLLGSGNIISQTPPLLSYQNAAVTALASSMQVVADGALAAVAVVGGLNVIVRPHVRAPYHGALELVPRLLLGAILVHTSLGWGQFAIDLNNEICRHIGESSMPAWANIQKVPSGEMVVLNLIAAGIYLVMGMLLTGQMMMRLALVDLLLVVAPLALLCWVLPQTYGWARLWFTTFFGTVFVQSIQVLVLRLGSELIQHLPILLASTSSNPVDTARTWITTLFFGVAVLQLTRKIPQLMPGMPGGMGSSASPINSVRGIAAVFNSGAAKSGGKKGGK